LRHFGVLRTVSKSRAISTEGWEKLGYFEEVKNSWFDILRGVFTG